MSDGRPTLAMETYVRLMVSKQRYRCSGFEVVGSRAIGGAWLLDGLWRALGVDRALRKVLGARRFSTEAERVLLALVANRALDPPS